MDIPEVRYAERDGRALAYQCWGAETGTDFLLLSEWPVNADSLWDHPAHLRLWRVFGSLGRLIRFDRSGIGSSDPDPRDAADPAAWAEDALAVMDAVGSESATPIAEGWGSHAGIALAVRHPDRVDRLVLSNGYARGLRSESYPIGIPAEALARMEEAVRSGWGSGAVLAPTFGEEYRDWCARYERAATSPGVAAAMAGAAFRSDVTDLLDRVTCPTLVAYTGDLPYIGEAASRYLAEHIAGAELVSDRTASYYELGSEAGRRLVAFAVGAAETAWADRQLAVVVFTDIVGSTEQLARRGDRDWVDVLETYQDVVEREVARFGGSVVKQTGDGHLLTFPSPGAAMSSVFGIRRAAHAIGLPLRFGIHMGEVEFRADGDVAGITVHTASRISALAEADQILGSSVIADLLAGTGLELADLGMHALKGVPREWRLFSVSRAGA